MPCFEYGESIIGSPSMKSAVSMTMAHQWHAKMETAYNIYSLGDVWKQKVQGQLVWMVSQIRMVQLKALTSI